MSSREQPRVGTRVEIAFLGADVPGTVEEIHDDGRRLVVLADDGELHLFRLSPITGRFTADGAQTGARLRFPADG